MKHILVTGGAGFIGSHFIRFLFGLDRGYTVVNLDKLTYAGNRSNLRCIEDEPGYYFYKGDICDKKLVSSLFREYGIDTVVNFAAESHVDRSIHQPDLFLRTNLYGTQVLLSCAWESWKNRGEGAGSCKADARFLQISTDEVYGPAYCGAYDERAPLFPSSPYAASKAGADMTAFSYFKTYGLPVLITRCSNNYGPHQFPEKLIPFMIQRCEKNEFLPVYGDGLQRRDWIHVTDHCKALIAVLERGKPGEIYNISSGCEKSNTDLVRTILKKCGKEETLIRYVTDRPGHDRRYALNASKIKNTLGWAPFVPFERGFDETIRWYQENRPWTREVLFRAAEKEGEHDEK